MSTRMGEHPQDWETQRERLSAYVDGELPAAERAALEAHLAGCARCAAELSELRQVAGLLRALPAARVPRSFTLPVDAPSVVPARSTAPALPATPRPLPAPSRPRAAARRAPWTGAAQWVGGLAAAAGLVILLSGAFAGMPRVREMAGSAARAPVSSTTGSHTFGGVAGPTNAPKRSIAGDGHTPTSAGAPSPGVASPGAQTPPAAPSVAPLTTPTTVQPPAPAGPGIPLWPITGGGLLIGGAVIVVVGRRAAGVH
jgi:hypothetical protein